MKVTIPRIAPARKLEVGETESHYGVVFTMQDDGALMADHTMQQPRNVARVGEPIKLEDWSEADFDEVIGSLLEAERIYPYEAKKPRTKAEPGPARQAEVPGGYQTPKDATAKKG